MSILSKAEVERRQKAPHNWPHDETLETALALWERVEAADKIIDKLQVSVLSERASAYGQGVVDGHGDNDHIERALEAAEKERDDYKGMVQEHQGRIRRMEHEWEQIDMCDLAPVTTVSNWVHAHYCAECLHEHPTVPMFRAELTRRSLAALARTNEPERGVE